MSPYQAVSLMLTFGLLLISLISYIDRDKGQKK
ncbi:MAG TPA: putative holin-like toxin [Clostridia bacterium]|nr:putative holin-like toxin [Clostridia bacterium]